MYELPDADLTSSSLPIAAWFQAFPIPAEQPNRAGTLHPLISPRSPFADDAPPLSEAAAKAHRTSHARPCLLAQDGSQRNFFFQEEGLGLENKWRKVNVVLPMPADKLERTKRPRSELDSPFLRIRHMLKLRIVCQNAVGDTEEAVRHHMAICVGVCDGTDGSRRPPRSLFLSASAPSPPPTPTKMRLGLLFRLTCSCTMRTGPGATATLFPCTNRRARTIRRRHSRP